jgi:hypothetical protein
MKKFNAIILILLLVSLANCTPTKISAVTNKASAKTSEVYIYYQNNTSYIKYPAILGYDNKDKIEIKDGAEVKLNVPNGRHKFFVRTKGGDRAYKKEIEIKKGKPTCLIISPNISKTSYRIPGMRYFKSIFMIEEKSC